MWTRSFTKLRRSLTDPTLILIIGGQRCGSTLLHDLLLTHPGISGLKQTFPEAKTFLNDHISKGDYLASFENPNQDFLLEKSTSYHEFPASINRAQEIFDGCKLVMILRNPVDRALSNYAFSVQNGLETRPIEAALFSDEDRRYSTSVNPYDYINRGKYMDYIAAIHNETDDLDLHIVILEELLNSPKSELDKLSDYLGVKNLFTTQLLEKKVNSTEYQEQGSLESTRKKLFSIFASTNEDFYRYIGREIDAWK